jgi:hypothetical protein
MAEQQAVSGIFEGLVQEIGPVISHLRPGNTVLQELGSESSALWSQCPYPHEARMVSAFLFVYEHEKQGNPLTQKDIGNLTKFFEWVHALPKLKNTSETPVGRTAPAVLLKPASKAMIFEQIDAMNDPEFIHAPVAGRQVLGFLRIHVNTLTRAQILPPIEEIQATVDSVLFESRS